VSSSFRALDLHGLHIPVRVYQDLIFATDATPDDLATLAEAGRFVI
jgi:hypothetical protein